MKREHYERYLSHRFQLLHPGSEQGVDILSGQLLSRTAAFDIVNGIPRFVPPHNYADNFGLQWNKFKSTQLDSFSGTSLSARRFWTSTRWSRSELSGKSVLEVGCGAGRFTEILLGCGAKVVAIDYSNAVDANSANNSAKGDLFLSQADLYDLPFPDECFDFVLCYGVLQHTPDPAKAYTAILRKLRPGGKLSIDCYRKRRVPTPWSTPKYLWRPITSRMEPRVLLRIIQWYMPFYLPLDTLLRKWPVIGPLLVALSPIPCWNYVDIGLNPAQRLEWAVMDTFDALGAVYDRPKTLRQVTEMVDHGDNDTATVSYGGNGILANIVKKSRPAS
jgi:SAM-dependent methyltransferase